MPRIKTNYNLLLIVFIVIYCFINIAPCISQKSLHFGTSIGISNYQGDLTEDQIELDEINQFYGIIAEYQGRPKLSYQFQISFTTLSGNDANSINLVDRGFKFSADTYEIIATTKWLILGRKRFNNQFIFIPQFSPYISAGLGFVYIDTELNFKPMFIDNLPEPNNKNSFLVVPIIIGARYDFHKNLIAEIELGFRNVFSDYIDNVSLVANPSKNDWYLIANISFKYAFTKYAYKEIRH